MAVSFDDYLGISETKARYCRCLDAKDWDGYGAVFTDDVVIDTTPAGGPEMRGREEVIRFVSGALDGQKTAHQVHQPEMRLTDADTAEVIWAMQDRVVRPGAHGVTGYGHYRERYVRGAGGGWLIAYSQLTRLHLDVDDGGRA